MDLWELLGRWQAREKDPLHTRTYFMQLNPGLPEKCKEYERGIDNLIRGLVDLLPKPDSVWPLDDRARWLRLAAAMFDVGYKAGDGEHREIGIACVKQDAASQPLDKPPALHPPSTSLMKRFDLGRGQGPMAAKKNQPDAMSDLQAALDILESRIQHDKA